MAAGTVIVGVDACGRWAGRTLGRCVLVDGRTYLYAYDPIFTPCLIESACTKIQQKGLWTGLHARARTTQSDGASLLRRVEARMVQTHGVVTGELCRRRCSRPAMVDLSM